MNEFILLYLAFLALGTKATKNGLPLPPVRDAPPRSRQGQGRLLKKKRRRRRR